MASSSKTLVDEKLAVSLFLDSLLREPEKEFVIPEIQSDIKVESPIIDKVVEINPEVKIQEDVIVENEVETTLETKLNPALEEKEATTPSIVPEWANEPFQILLFEVAGLKLAVPLIELCGVIKWKDTITEMPGHADFYLGILQHLNYKIAVIDTAKMVLPPKKLSQLAGDNPRDRLNHIVLIDNYRWGLACDNIGEVITLKPDDVRWRTSKTSRGWLAGTVIEHMCALLNSEGFSSMLDKGS